MNTFDLYLELAVQIDPTALFSGAYHLTFYIPFQSLFKVLFLVGFKQCLAGECGLHKGPGLNQQRQKF